MAPRTLFIGRTPPESVAAGAPDEAYPLMTHELVTHSVVLGMTGSGKTGLATVLVEEVLRNKVPVLMIDIKGDLPNLLLAFPDLSPAEFLPWVDQEAATREGSSAEQRAEQLAARWSSGLASSGLGPTQVAELKNIMAPRIITPGASIGEPLNVLSALERTGSLWEEDVEAAHDAVAAAVSLALRLIGKDGDPRSRSHVVLSTLAERRLRAGQPADLGTLLRDVQNPPIERIGALSFNEFLPEKEQRALAQELNTLIASPKLQSWLKGAPLDVGSWLTPQGGKTPAVIVSVAHLDDEERQLILGLLLEEVLSYVRSLSGTSELRALVVFDEVFGFLPPHPHNPPSKRPLLALLKQARAFGVGVMVATQNPMDLDYKALSNAGVWMIGRLQTDADRDRVVEGLSGLEGSAALDAATLGNLIKGLPKRAFFVRNVHKSPATSVFTSRFCMSFLRGPLTRRELSKLAKTLEPPRPPTFSESVGATPSDPARAPGGTVVMGALPPLAAASAPVIAGPVSPPVATAPAPTSHGVPNPPEGWRTYHGATQSVGPVRYAPYVAATFLQRLRDKTLGLSIDRQLSMIAPLIEGRPDLARAVAIDARSLHGQPAPGASYAPLPSELANKKNVQGVERMLKGHAESFPLTLVVSEALGLFRGETEEQNSFLLRCQSATLERIGEAKQAAQSKAAPKLAKLHDKLASAERQLFAARAALGQAPSGMGAAFMGLVAGKGAASQLVKSRNKAETGATRAQSAYQSAHSAHSAAQAELASELTHLEAKIRAESSSFSERKFVPKKGDCELLTIGVAWSAGG